MGSRMRRAALCCRYTANLIISTEKLRARVVRPIRSVEPPLRGQTPTRHHRAHPRRIFPPNRSVAALRTRTLGGIEPGPHITSWPAYASW